MSTFRQISTNTLYQVVGKALGVFFSLITTGLLTRHLGQAGYGQYTLITTLVIFFGSITDWGTGFIAARMASQKLYSPPSVYGNLFIIRFLSALLGILLMLSLTLIHVIALPLPLVLVASLILFTLVIRNTIQVIFQVNLKLQYGAIVEAITSFFFVILVYWGVTTSSLSPQLVVTYLLIATTLSAVIGLIFALKISPIRFTVNRSLLKPLLYEALPMGTLLVVFSIYNRLDSFLLQYFQGDQVVGVYGLAYKIHDHAVLGAAFFMNALYPLIAKSGVGNPKTKQLFSTAFHLLLLVGLSVSILIFIFAQPIVLLLSDISYLPAVPLIRILTFATFIAYLNHLTGYTLAALGLQRTSLKIALSALILNLTLNYLFIPHFSYYASASITILTEALVFSISIIYLYRTQQLSPSFLNLPRTISNLLFHRKQLFN